MSGQGKKFMKVTFGVPLFKYIKGQCFFTFLGGFYLLEGLEMFFFIYLLNTW